MNAAFRLSIFDDKEDCFLQAYEAALGGLTVVVADASSQATPWPEQIRLALDALLEALSNDRDLARVVMVEVLAAGPRAIGRYTDALTNFVPLLAIGRTETRNGPQLPPQAERVIVGGLATLVHNRVAAGTVEDLQVLLPDLLYFALVPFVGSAQAAKVAGQACFG